jgi:hypothetical protein
MNQMIHFLLEAASQSILGATTSAAFRAMGQQVQG